MTDIRHYLNGVLVNPRDFESARVVMDWAGKKEAANITVNSINLVAKEGTLLRERILSGLNGGVGFFEGEPYRIEVGDLGSIEGVFEAYLDFTEGLEFIGECEVQATLKREQGTDWLNDVADGFSYRYLESIGVITDSDFVEVPYVINYIPDGVELLILSISTFVLTKELIETVRSISKQIVDLVKQVTPNVGVGVGLGAVSVTSWSIGQIVGAVINLVIEIAYAVAVVIAIVKLVEQIIEQLMPPKRFHLGMTVKDLFEKGCDYLNLKLSSGLLDSLDRASEKWVVIPSKGHRGGEKPTGAGNDWRETGVPSVNTALDTFGGVVRTFKRVFNADYQIKDGTFIFERRDFFRKTSGYVIPDTFINQDTLQDLNGFNTDEARAAYNINWAFDQQDLNTLDNQEGRVFSGAIRAYCCDK